MARQVDNGAVRPLGESRRQAEHQHLPGMIAVALIVAGGMAGYLFGLPGDTALPAAATVTTTNVPAVEPLATPLHYQWLEQSPMDSEQDAWAVHAAEDLNDVIYLLVSDDRYSPLSRVLWRSRDGKQWEVMPLDLGPGAQVTDLDVYGQSLLLSGWVGTTPTIWRSQASSTSTDIEWIAAPLVSDLDAVGLPITELSSINTVVNSAGSVVTTANVEINLEPSLLSLTEDPGVTSLLHFAEFPDVAVSSTRLWMRIVDPDGEESVHTIQIPTSVRVRPVSGQYGIDIGALQAWAIWGSTDATGFTPIDLPAVLTGPLQTMPFGDSFAATTTSDGGGTDLWVLADSVWTPSTWEVPAECGDWRRTVADGHRLVTISDDFDTACISEDGLHWVVRASSSTAVSSPASIWIEGSGDGFIAMAGNSLEYAVLTSADGLEWVRVNTNPDTVATRVFRVGDRLVTTARPAGSMIPRPVVVWVGTPTGG